METILPNSQERIARRRFALFMSVALVVGLIGWLWICWPNSLQRQVEAVGGTYSERNLDLPTQMSMRSLLSLVDAVVNKALGKDRRSISIVFYKNGEMDDWVRLNAEAMKNLPIHYISFRRTAITDDAVTDLAGMRSLTMLDLAGTAITDQSLSAISKMPDLRLIDLTDTDVTKDGIWQLADHPMMKHMEIDGDILTDETLTHLNAMPRLRSLALKDADNDQLSLLGGLKRIEALSLTGATDESLPFLLRLNQLQYLSLTDSQLSPDSIEMIRDTLPNLSIRQNISLEAAEELGVLQNSAHRQRVVRVAFFVIVVTGGSLSLFVGLICRRRWAQRHP